MSTSEEQRHEDIQNAAAILESLEGEDLVMAVTGLIELAKHAGGECGFVIVVDDGTAALQCRKYSDDTFCEGLSVEALSAIVDAVGDGR